MFNNCVCDIIHRGSASDGLCCHCVIFRYQLKVKSSEQQVACRIPKYYEKMANNFPISSIPVSPSTEHPVNPEKSSANTCQIPVPAIRKIFKITFLLLTLFGTVTSGSPTSAPKRTLSKQSSVFIHDQPFAVVNSQSPSRASKASSHPQNLLAKIFSRTKRFSRNYCVETHERLMKLLGFTHEKVQNEQKKTRGRRNTRSNNGRPWVKRCREDHQRLAKLFCAIESRSNIFGDTNTNLIKNSIGSLMNLLEQQCGGDQEGFPINRENCLPQFPGQSDKFVVDRIATELFSFRKEYRDICRKLSPAPE